MPPERGHREVRHWRYGGGSAHFDLELPRREVIRVTDLARCTMQEVLELFPSPQVLDLCGFCSMLQRPSKQEELQCMQARLLRRPRRKTGRDTRRGSETVELVMGPYNGLGPRGRRRGTRGQRQRSRGPGGVPLHSGQRAWGERQATTRGRRLRSHESQKRGGRRTK